MPYPATLLSSTPFDVGVSGIPGPNGGDYQQTDQFVPGDTIDSLVLPAIRLSVAALFA